MIVIKDVPLKIIGELDEELGHYWRNGNLPLGMTDGYANVTLGENVIFKAYTDGLVVLDIGGNKAFIPSESYREVTIT